MFTLEELSRKDVINVKNGCRIGFIRDIELNESGNVSAITVECAGRGFSFKKPELMKVLWNDIVIIGKETILVNDAKTLTVPSSKKGRLSDLF